MFRAVPVWLVVIVGFGGNNRRAIQDPTISTTDAVIAMMGP